MKLPSGYVQLVEPDFAGRLNGFTLLFELFILMLSGQMTFYASGHDQDGHIPNRWKAQLPGHQSLCWTTHMKFIRAFFVSG